MKHLVYFLPFVLFPSSLQKEFSTKKKKQLLMWALGFHAAGWMGFSPLVDEETLGLLAGRS